MSLPLEMESAAVRRASSGAGRDASPAPPTTNVSAVSPAIRLWQPIFDAGAATGQVEYDRHQLGQRAPQADEFPTQQHPVMHDDAPSAVEIQVTMPLLLISCRLVVHSVCS